jgi:hypothetical protein
MDFDVINTIAWFILMIYVLKSFYKFTNSLNPYDFSKK